MKTYVLLVTFRTHPYYVIGKMTGRETNEYVCLETNKPSLWDLGQTYEIGCGGEWKFVKHARTLKNIEKLRLLIDV
jgi:hypothetical protein